MAITITHQDERDETSPAVFGEKKHLEYAAEVTFPELVFESLSGSKPNEKQLKLFNLILNLCFDHGPNPPSEAATIAATKEGKEMGESVAAGITQVNDQHGGAGEPLMGILYQINDQRIKIKELVQEYEDQKKRMPGFGHRIYKDQDPRAQLILKTIRENDVGVEFADILEQIHQELINKGKNLPINIDGAIAAAMCGLGLEPKLGKAVFIVARSAGLIAHYLNNDPSLRGD